MQEIKLDVGGISISVIGDFSMEIENSNIKIYPFSNSSIHNANSVEGPSEISVSPSLSPNVVFDVERLRSGSQALYGLVEIWRKNFGIENTVQPNRINALHECMTHHGDALILFLRHQKGLTTAICELFPPLPNAEAIQLRDHLNFNRQIACNIAQVSSIAASELCEYLEPHSNYTTQSFYW